jgi:hypothetical protein
MVLSVIAVVGFVAFCAGLFLMETFHTRLRTYLLFGAFVLVGFLQYRKDPTRPGLGEPPDFLTRRPWASHQHQAGAVVLRFALFLPGLCFHLMAHVLRGGNPAHTPEVEDLAFDIATRARNTVTRHAVKDDPVTLDSLEKHADPKQVRAALTLLEHMGFVRTRTRRSGETEILPRLALESFLDEAESGDLDR